MATQSAVMAGFTLTSFVEIDLPPNKMVAKAMLHFFITMSICSNFLCVAMVTFVTVWGSGKALRGLDGSMDVAVDGMNGERAFIFTAFAVGVLATLGCLFAAGWVLMETEIALIASVLVLTTMYMVIAEARRIHNRFYLAPDEHVTFEELRDIFPATRGEGAATRRQLRRHRRRQGGGDRELPHAVARRNAAIEVVQHADRKGARRVTIKRL